MNSFHSDLPEDVKAPILSFEESCRLECVISPPFGLETAIRHSMERGLYMDSSWRNKNAQKCPVTIVATINQYHRMIPSRFETASYMLCSTHSMQLRS